MARHRGFAWLAAVAAGIVVLSLLANLAERVAETSTARGGTLPPQSAPGPGVYPEGVSVTIQPFQARGQVVLSIDGSVPTAEVGQLYEGPIRFEATHRGVRVIRAAEILGRYTGPVVTSSYVVGLPQLAAAAVPIVSLVADPPDLWSESRGILANPAWRGSDWERPAHLTLFLGNGTYAAPVGVRVDSDVPPSSPKQSLRLYARESYGTPRLEAPIFPSPTGQSAQAQSYRRLVLQAGEHAVVWSLLRDQVVSAIARDLGLPVVEGRPVWLFINGDSWGLYRLTERVDRFMLEAALGLREADVLQEGNPRDGADDAWDELIDWADAIGFPEEETLDRAASRIDLANLVDFAILQEVFDFPPAALVAVRPHGGRWFWVFEGSADERVARSDLERLLEGLRASPQFRSMYSRRAADLVNSVLTPASVAAYVDALDDVLGSSAAREAARWPGGRLWTDEVAALERSTSRRTTDLIQRLALSSQLTLRVSPPGTGVVYVNGSRVETGALAWRGVYGQGAAVNVIAVPNPDYAFSGWKGDADSGAVSTTVPVSGTISLVAAFEPRQRASAELLPDDVMINELWINDNGSRYPTLGQRALEGDWVELLVRSVDPVDMRGWRLTDNNEKDTISEGSLWFPQYDALAAVPCGTVVLIVATASPSNAAAFPFDDLDASDRRLLLYVGNGHLDASTDPGFGLGPRDDNLVLLAPGPTAILGDDLVVDFVAEGRLVTPFTFGALADGVAFDVPFGRLGQDDGALLTGTTGSDNIGEWYVDPTACESYDAACLEGVPMVSPGALNRGQAGFRLRCAWQRTARRPHDE